MDLDQLYIGVTTLLLATGIVYGIMTYPQVSSVRKVWYYISLPILFGFFAMYLVAFIDFSPRDAITSPEILLRVLLFGVAMKGVLVPFMDRLEIRSRVHEIHIKQAGEGEE